MRFLSVGDNCLDHYAELGQRFPGGNSLNVAVYANRISNVEATYIGVVGTDENGDFILDEMRREGLKTDNVIRLHGNTAVTTIHIRNGERVFVNYDAGIQKNAVLPHGLLREFNNYDIVHFTVWGFGKENINELKRISNLKISFDFSNQFDNEALKVLPWVDYSFFSGKELIRKEVDLEEFVTNLKKRTPGLIIMTLGEYGSIAFDGETFYKGQAKPVNVLDTLGAGDSFIASFLCSKNKGVSIDSSLEKGHEASRKICSRLGAWGGVA